MSNIILAAGTQTRWNAQKYKGIPVIKQLIEIEGEVLIERIQRQFPGAIVVTKTNDIKKHSHKWFDPAENIVTLATLFSTRDLWEDWTTVLLGDVNYGDHTIGLIENQTDEMMFYGDKGEIYAIKFSLKSSINVIGCINNIVSAPMFERKYGKLWNLYRMLNATDFRTHIIKDYFTRVSDCKDFDTQKQYIRYAKNQRVRKQDTGLL